jgi:uncharacterized phage protein gp47/JayE
MPIGENGYEQFTEDESFENFATALLAEEPDANPQSEATLVNANGRALARVIADEIEPSLQATYRSAYVEDATGNELTKKCRNLGVYRKEAIRATGVVTFSRSDPASSDITIPAGTAVETLEQDPVQFETTSVVTLSSGTSSVDATVRAVNGGSDGNVGPNAIQVMPSPPAGIDTVTNQQATGDPTLTDTSGDPLVPGRDRESDQSLRDRVLDTDASDEGPSGNGIELALARVEDVISTHINANPQSTSNNSLDPYHSEVVVYGGDTYTVVETLYETMSVTNILRLQGGVNGTKETANVYSNILEQEITVPITRPAQLTFDCTIDVVHTSDYDGDDAVQNAIVNYVGGTYVDDSSAVGTLLGENVLVNEIENRVEDVQGVDYANVTLIDTNNDGTDDTTTDSDGVPILSVSNSEVARVDADNITVNTTAR